MRLGALSLAVVVLAVGCSSGPEPAPAEGQPAAPAAASPGFTWDDPEIRDDTSLQAPQTVVSFSAADEEATLVRGSVTDRGGQRIDLVRVRIVRVEEGLFGSSEDEILYLPVRYASGEIRVPLNRIRALACRGGEMRPEGDRQVRAPVTLGITNREGRSIEAQADATLLLRGDAEFGQFQIEFGSLGSLEVSE